MHVSAGSVPDFDLGSSDATTSGAYWLWSQTLLSPKGAGSEPVIGKEVVRELAIAGEDSPTPLMFSIFVNAIANHSVANDRLCNVQEWYSTNTLYNETIKV